MTRSPIPLGETLWLREEARLFDVFERAFAVMLGKQTPLPTEENEISRELHFCIRYANEELRKFNRHVEFLPMFRCRRQPDYLGPAGTSQEEKEPDFQWQWRDPQESDPRRCYKEYMIECKRLGSPPSRFCKDYVTKGICRFRNPEHSYGKYLPSGMMIGYVQSMELAGILVFVNSRARGNGLADLVLSGAGWQVGGTSRLDQEVSRPEVEPSPFSLRHFWVDLRRKPRPSSRRGYGPS